MKKDSKIALSVSLIVLIGFPLLFFFVSLVTGQWHYLLWSLPPSFTAGFTGLVLTLNQIRKKG
ncbi:hypothetical protein DRW41_04570 [Neobacillus piezotolerans]|uniref:Uncharacterized protein n=1 Tax=Neobacillus piezotolerans TaxID=2259171 RepID=A0A3D8GXP9_9BACI|nr:hypothetical protein [Neobacillus piezotolerans]RDU38836.1 hypothetical protein DRW41_04570 [Neobacillus piezotolerans]